MSLIKLQEKIGAEPDGILGKNTLKLAAKYFKLTPEQAAHFFGQTSHETGGFRLFVENLNYSADGLKKIFKKYFPTNLLAQGYARKPEKIANRVYSNRMGNGDENSGDGWKFRGRGALQTTGKTNYTQLSEHLKNPNILSNPDIVANEFAFESALFYFTKNNLWRHCGIVNDDSIKRVTRAVNGGFNGLEDRLDKTKKYYEWLK